LNATANVAGTFAYAPTAGTVLPAGTRTLSVTFTPADTVHYTAVTRTVSIDVTKATPVVTWATPAPIVYGTPLSATQLAATPSVAGTFAYAPAAGTVLPAGTHTLAVTFTPTDAANYTTTTRTVSIDVTKATPVVTWVTPAPIVSGTPLSVTQLNATANVPGMFAYAPTAGTVLPVGTHTLSATFTPVDPANYTAVTRSVLLGVMARTAGPVVTALTPGLAVAGSGGFTLVVTGEGFVDGAVVSWGGSPRATTWVSSTVVHAAIPAADVAAAGLRAVVVSQGGQASNAVTFTIDAAVVTVTPPGDPATPVEIVVAAPTGAVRVSLTGVTTGGTLSVTVPTTPPATPIPSPFARVGRVYEVSAPAVVFTQATLCLPYDDAEVTAQGLDEAALRLLHDVGGAYVDVTTSLDTTANTICGTVTSLSPFVIVGTTGENPSPTLTSVTPSQVAHGEADLTITASGTGFVASTVVRLDGQALATTYESATTLTAVVPSAECARGRHAAVTVTTPAPGGGTSAALPFVVLHASFLAEGATSAFFDTRLALLNPGDMATVATITFARAGAAAVTTAVPVPARTRVTVDPKTVPGLATAEFSTRVDADQPLVVDRTMSWSPAQAYGAHAETAALAPALTWYLAEGATHSAFNLFYLLQNPNASAADVRVRYLRPSGPPLEKTYTLAPTSRTNIWVDVEEVPGIGQALANTDVSAVVEVLNGQPIIVERAMYADVPGQMFGAGHESAGVTAPATEWFLAEGATGPFFDLFVLVANPSSQMAQVTATYLLPDATTVVKEYTVPATSRFNIWVDYEDARLADTAVSTTLRSTNGVAVIAERAMWWPQGRWYEAHNSPGATTTGTTWALAEGEVEAARNLETYILIANTSTTPADVRVTLCFEDGASAAWTFNGIPAQSRFNVPVGGVFPAAAGKRFGAIVESLGTSPAPIVVERAMYWDAAGQRWAAGTNALATRLR
jgi:hypothetical protein